MKLPNIYTRFRHIENRVLEHKSEMFRELMRRNFARWFEPQFPERS